LAIFPTVTGDAPATVTIAAATVGLDGAICPAGPIPDGVGPEKFAVYGRSQALKKGLRSHFSTCVCTHVVAARSEEPRHGSIELTAPHCGEIRKAMGKKTRSSGAGMEAGKARRP
jgi:hypothetical protein